MTVFPEFCVVFTTTADREQAERIAAGLVASRLAACVQLLPIASYFIWDDQAQREAEWLLLIKTRGELYPAIEKHLREIHPYEVPEMLCLPVVTGYNPYLNWVRAQTQA